MNNRKVQLTESQLKSIVRSCSRYFVNEIKSGKISRKNISEAIDRFDIGGYILSEAVSQSNQGDETKRRAVISFLTKPECDAAQYAYKLWPDKDKDSCRSYFYKCLNGELDDNGNRYDFSSSEINDLHSMISNNSI